MNKIGIYWGYHMLFNSVKFLLFFAVGALVYYLVPKKLQWPWLLGMSVFFYACFGTTMFRCLLLNILSTYAAALLIGKLRSQKQTASRLILAFVLLLNLGLLLYLKYYNFFADAADDLFRNFALPILLPERSLLLPLGISFYTLQTAGYCIDIYRGKYLPERNPAKYALFVLFFPCIMQGPIGRYDALSPTLFGRHKFEEHRFAAGMQRMLWGYFKKMVVADRAAILVDQVFNHYSDYSGAEILIASFFYTVQLYADFSGYVDIAAGAAECFGVRIAENFSRPYFAKSIQDFWRRWHRTLSFWLRDYLYIPLGGNRKGKVRKYLNVMIVFLVSGLWHGVGFHYLVWGFLHGFEQVAGALLMPLRNRSIKLLHVNRAGFSHRLYQVIVTFCLVSFNWIFFRASSVSGALRMIRSMVSVWNPWIFFDGTLYTLGLSMPNFWIAVSSFCLMLLVSLLQRSYSLRSFIGRQSLPFRWGLYFAGTFAVLIFGVYGIGYNAADFIYMQF